MKLYMDEAGHTGEDLINQDQPIFALASTVLNDKECQAIQRDVFASVKSSELKHASLSRKSAGQQRVVEFLRAIQQTAGKAGVYIVHKEYALLTKLVDWWVEPSMHSHGYDLYRRGGHIALSNLAYVTTVSVASRAFLRLLLLKFQTMMRRRTLESYREFWVFVKTHHRTAHPIVKEVLEYFLVSEMDLGFAHLRSLPPRALDITMTVAHSTLNTWRAELGGPFYIIHDSSSSMAKEKWLWDQLVSPDQEPAVLGTGDHTIYFPLNVTSTTFADSKSSLQLQFSDVLAGSMAKFAASKADRSCRSNYTDTLEKAGIQKLLIGGIWPSDEVDPAELGTESMSGEVLDAITARIKVPKEYII